MSETHGGLKPTTEPGLQAVKLLRAYMATPVEDRQGKLYEVAKQIVQIRALYTAPDGGQDWKGQSKAYRQEIRRVYGSANLGEERSNIMANIRYHTGQAIREQLDDSELERLGLLQKTPRQRLKDRYRSAQSILDLFKGSADTDDLGSVSSLNALHAASQLMTRAEVNELRTSELDLAGQHLAAIDVRWRTLSAELETRRVEMGSEGQD